MRNLSYEEVQNLDWRDLKTDPPADGMVVYSRAKGTKAYCSTTQYRSKSKKLITVRKHSNRTVITVWHNDQWAHHPDAAGLYRDKDEVAKLKKKVGTISYAIANSEAYGHTFPHIWLRQISDAKDRITHLENKIKNHT